MSKPPSPHRYSEPGEDLDDVVDELFGSWWVEGADAGFEPSATIKRPRLRGTAGVAQDPAESWRALGGKAEAQPEVRKRAEQEPPAPPPEKRRGLGSLLRRK